MQCDKSDIYSYTKDRVRYSCISTWDALSRGTAYSTAFWTQQQHCGHNEDTRHSMYIIHALDHQRWHRSLTDTPHHLYHLTSSHNTGKTYILLPSQYQCCRRRRRHCIVNIIMHKVCITNALTETRSRLWMGVVNFHHVTDLYEILPADSLNYDVKCGVFKGQRGSKSQIFAQKFVQVHQCLSEAQLWKACYYSIYELPPHSS